MSRMGPKAANRGHFLLAWAVLRPDSSGAQKLASARPRPANFVILIWTDAHRSSYNEL